MVTNYNYSPGCGVCLGVFHIIFGLGSCGCGIAAIVLHSYAANIAVGIWAGVVFYMVTGILGLASASRKNSVITAYYVMALLSVFVAMGQMGMYIFAVMQEVWRCLNDFSSDFSGCSKNQIQDLIMHGVLVVIAFLEWVVAMVSCCTACTCCFNNDVAPTQTVVIHTMQQPAVQPLPTHGGPAVFMPTPQANYAGYLGSNAPAASMQPALGYSEKAQFPLDSTPVYHNPTFDSTTPADENAFLPHTPEPSDNTKERSG